MPGAFMLPTTLRPVLPGILFPRQQYPRQVLYMFGVPVKLNSSQLYRHAGSKDWDASLVSNPGSHTLSQTVLATILQIG